MSSDHPNTESAPALKPCPFCKESPEPILVDGSAFKYQGVLVMRHPYSDCILTGMKIIGPKDYATWNRRSPYAERDATIEECAKVAESAVAAGESVRNKMAPPISGLEDALHSIVITTARNIAANIRSLRRAGEKE